MSEKLSSLIDFVKCQPWAIFIVISMIFYYDLRTVLVTELDNKDKLIMSQQADFKVYMSETTRLLDQISERLKKLEEKN